jgi:ABC-type amino acid transport substrate-binding protein
MGAHQAIPKNSVMAKTQRDGKALHGAKGVSMSILRIPIFILALFFAVAMGEACAEDQSLSYKKLIVGTKEAPPFVIKKSDGSWTGISIELWRELAAELNLIYEFREVDLKGLLDGVTDGSLDAAVAALTITPEREKRFDFTHPFYSTGLGIATPSKTGNPWLAVLKRFFSRAFLRVLGVLLLLLLSIGFLVWWFERRKNPKQFGGGVVKGIASAFWFSAVTMTTVGYGDKAPVSVGGRIVTLIWMFAAIIVISSITAAITASLTLSQLESPVSGFDDLQKVQVGTVLNSTSAEHLVEKRISFRSFKTVADGLQAMSDGAIEALVYDAPVLRYLVNQKYKGRMTVLPNTFLRQDYGIALTAGNPLRETINLVLLDKISDPSWQELLDKYLGR